MAPTSAPPTAGRSHGARPQLVASRSVRTTAIISRMPSAAQITPTASAGRMSTAVTEPIGPISISKAWPDSARDTKVAAMTAQITGASDTVL